MSIQPAPRPTLPDQPVSRSPRRPGWRAGAALAGAAALLALAACGGVGSDDSADASGGGGNEGTAAVDGGGDSLALQREAPANAVDSRTTVAALTVQRSVISTGVVALRADDVAELRSLVWQVVDEHAGQVTDEESEGDTEGNLTRARLVVRVPAEEFDDTMAALREVGDVESSSHGSEDVTTQVIDTNVRVRAQEASLKRIEALLARAQSLRDIVAIESELTRRQADLDSLKQQQAWLADQTSMSTINVHLRQTQEPGANPTDEDGFLAGLAAGWHGLKKVTTGLLTGFGAVLPFAIVTLALAAPVGMAVRRSRRRRAPSDPGPATA